MQRVFLAALAGGMVLQLWAAAIAALLPRPAPVIGPLPTVVQQQARSAEMLTEPGSAQEAAVPDVPEDLELPSIPPRGHGQPAAPQFPSAALIQHVLISFAIGLVAALASCALPDLTTWKQRLGLLLLGGLLCVLIANLDQAAIPDWPGEPPVVRCIHHFGGVVLVAAVATLIIGARRPTWLPRKGASP